MTQRVIVTAAARGIGRSIAAAFLTTGARVHICDVDDVAIRSFEDGFPDARAALVDLADPASVDAWLDDAIADLGGVDVLVNNAGTKGPTVFVEGVPVDVVTAEYVAGQSIKRFVEPDEIAQLCLFLASSAASMITGQAIAIDGHSETYRL